MKIKYQTSSNSTDDDIMYNTKCPFKRTNGFGDIFVAGWACKECKDFVSNNDFKQIVVCNGKVSDLAK